MVMVSKRRLSEILKRDKRVSAAYLFGSAARGETGALSDVDIGIFADESLNSGEMLKLRLDLINRLSSVVGDNADIVIMNEAPALLNYNIIKGGRVLKSHLGSSAMVEKRVIYAYRNMRPYIRRHAKAVIDRIAKRGLS